MLLIGKIGIGVHRHVVLVFGARCWYVYVCANLLAVEPEREVREGIGAWDGVRDDVIDVHGSPSESRSHQPRFRIPR